MSAVTTNLKNLIKRNQDLMDADRTLWINKANALIEFSIDRGLNSVALSLPSYVLGRQLCDYYCEVIRSGGMPLSVECLTPTGHCILLIEYKESSN